MSRSARQHMGIWIGFQIQIVAWSEVAVMIRAMINGKTWVFFAALTLIALTGFMTWWYGGRPRNWKDFQ